MTLAKLKGWALAALAVLLAVAAAFASGWRKGSAGKEDELVREQLEGQLLRQEAVQAEIIEAVQDRQEVEDDVQGDASARDRLRDRWGS